MHCSLQERKYGWGLQSMKSEGCVLAWQRWSLLHTERRSSLRRPVLSTQKTQPRTVAGAAPQHASQSHSHTGASQRMLTLGAVIVTSCQNSQTMENTTVSDQIWVVFQGFCFYTSCICKKKMSMSGCVTWFGIRFAVFCWMWFELCQILYRSNSLKRSWKWIFHSRASGQLWGG